MRRLITTILICFVSIYFGLTQSIEYPKKYYTLTGQNPKCEGGVEKLNEIFSEILIKNNELLKLERIQLTIDSNSIIEIVATTPKLTVETEDLIRDKLNAIRWLPAYQQNLPVNFYANFYFKLVKNNLILINNLIEPLPPIMISGTTIDSETKLPIPDVIIDLIDKNQRLHSNRDGKFQLFVDDNFTNNMVRVSHACYVEYDFQMPDSKNIIVPLNKTFLNFKEFNAKEYSPTRLPNKIECSYKDWHTNDYYATISYASIPGGRNCLENFIIANFKYPEMAFTSNYEGKAEIDLIINSNGKAENITLNGDINFGIEEELRSLLLKMPKWQPALQKNLPINQKIKFMLIFGNNKYWKKIYTK